MFFKMPCGWLLQLLFLLFFVIIKSFIEASATPHVEASFLGYNFDVV
jgi:hypothetical protein